MDRAAWVWIGVVVVLMLLAGAVAGPGGQHRASAATPAKKHCKTVKRHGKKVKVCTAKKPKPKPRPSPTPPVTVQFPGPSNPKSITTTTDSSRAVSMSISAADGGTIVATGADGTTYTLDIPRNALPDDTTVTMTPVSSVSGLPLSHGLAAGVQLAPDGLRLVAEATLTMVPARAVALANQIPFAYRGSGSSVFLYPLVKDKAHIIFPLFHFSGYGLGDGTSGDQQQMADFGPPDAEDDFAQQMGILIDNWRSGVIDEQTFEYDATELGSDYWNQVIRPSLTPLGSLDNEDLASAISSKALGFLRDMILATGNEKEWEADEQTTFEAIIREANYLEKKAQDRCATHRGGPVGYNRGLSAWLLLDPDDISTILAMERQKQLLGAAESDLPTLLKSCEAHGFKFDTATFTETANTEIGPVTIVDTFSGHVCGSSPWGTWTLAWSRDFNSTGLQVQKSGPPSLSIPQNGPTVYIPDTEGFSVQMSALAGPPSVFRIAVTPNSGFTIDHDQLDTPLLDDATCP